MNTLLKINKMKTKLWILINISSNHFKVFSIIICTLFFNSFGYATHYYVSNSGNDLNSGTSPSQAWATLDKVNSSIFSAGDIISFECNSVWRGQLIPTSGNTSSHITYNSYGTGMKPKILGSSQMNDQDSWINLGNNRWSSNNNKIVNPSFDSGLQGWSAGYQGNATASFGVTTSSCKTPPLSCMITVTNNGDFKYDIQLFQKNLSIVNGKRYRLTFSAKTDNPFSMHHPSLIKQSPPYNAYYSSFSSWTGNITQAWSEFYIDFTSNITANDAQIEFWLGSSIPDGATLFLDDILLQEVSTNMPIDVGNIIFFENSNRVCGRKKGNLSDLAQQNDFWYDNTNKCLTIYSAENPAQKYTNIECALKQNIIYIKSKCFITIDGLDVAYGSLTGICCEYAHDIKINNCSISYTGGSFTNGSSHIRFGNGIDFWNTTTNCIVTNNFITQVYDAAITNQGIGFNTQRNIQYRNNTISYCEYSLELWDCRDINDTIEPIDPIMDSIYFENNFCSFAGGGWSHTQRVDPSGRHIALYSSTANATNIFIRYNTFHSATNKIIHKVSAYNDIGNVIIDYNKYYQTPDTNFANWDSVSYNFDSYKIASGKDEHSTLNSFDYNNLFAYYPLDTNPYDISLNENNGINFNGINYTSNGQIDGTAAFDGVDDQIRINNYSVFNQLGNSFTLAAWIHPLTVERQYQTIMAKVNPNRDFNFLLNYNRLRFHFAHYDIYYSCTIDLTDTLSAGNWYHVVAVWDAPNMLLYINGELKKTATYVNTYPLWTGTRLGIGTMDWSYVFYGLIDDARIFDAALGTNDIKSFYQIGLNGLKSSRIYNFEEIFGKGYNTRTQVKDIVVSDTVNTNININEPLLSNELIVYPSPAMNQLNIQLPIDCNNFLNYIIVNSAGFTVSAKKIFLLKNKFILDINELKSGLYLIKINCDKYENSQIFIKK